MEVFIPWRVHRISDHVSTLRVAAIGRIRIHLQNFITSVTRTGSSTAIQFDNICPTGEADRYQWARKK
jgi:hypothetical protein